MSTSLKDSLQLEDVLQDGAPAYQALYLRNLGDAQTTVNIQSTQIVSKAYNLKSAGNYDLVPSAVTIGVSGKTQLAKAKPGNPVTLVAGPISRLVYNFLTAAMEPNFGKFPTYDQLQLTVIGNTLNYTLQVDPLLVDVPADMMRYPIFLQVSTAAMNALRGDATGTIPPSTIYPSQFYIDQFDIGTELPQLLVGRDNWMKHFIQTPDQQWWYVTWVKHVFTDTLQTNQIATLFNPDGHTEDNPFSATLNRFTVVSHPANFDACAGATVDLALRLTEDSGIEIKVDDATYSFTGLNDLMVNAETRLPPDIYLEFLSARPKLINTYMGLMGIHRVGGGSVNVVVQYGQLVSEYSATVTNGSEITQLMNDVIQYPAARTLIVPSSLPTQQPPTNDMAFLLNTGPGDVKVDYELSSAWPVPKEISGNDSYTYDNYTISSVIKPYEPYPTNSLPPSVHMNVEFTFNVPLEGDAVFLLRTSLGGDREIRMVSNPTNTDGVILPELGIRVKYQHDLVSGKLTIVPMDVEVTVTVMVFRAGNLSVNTKTLVDGANGERHTFQLQSPVYVDNLLFRYVSVIPGGPNP